MQSLVKMYGHLGLEKVKKVAKVQAEIKAEVAYETEMHQEILMGCDLYNRIWAQMPEMDPKIRTRHEMVCFTAVLELIANQLRDEVADEQYQQL